MPRNSDNYFCLLFTMFVVNKLRYNATQAWVWSPGHVASPVSVPKSQSITNNRNADSTTSENILKNYRYIVIFHIPSYSQVLCFFI